MHDTDIESCASFVYANRLIAERFRSEAGIVLDLAQIVEDPDERMRLVDLIQVLEERVAIHLAIAEQQERDMGRLCHCPRGPDDEVMDYNLSTLECAIQAMVHRLLPAQTG
jgi:hypothetical protein